ncbi:hypothetical protein TNCV_1739781 [Trichonephila clavipes]|nr:hypothetical protein TNCV_1739781 [Trichonephila clavipes]
MLPVLGKKAVLEWCVKEVLIGSSYGCPKCGKSMELRERTEVWRVVGRLEGGQTQAEVTQAIGVSQSVISRIWNRFWETGSAGRNQDKVVDGQQRPKKIVI